MNTAPKRILANSDYARSLGQSHVLAHGRSFHYVGGNLLLRMRINRCLELTLRRLSFRIAISSSVQHVPISMLKICLYQFRKDSMDVLGRQRRPFRDAWRSVSFWNVFVLCLSHRATSLRLARSEYELTNPGPQSIRHPPEFGIPRNLAPPCNIIL